jgi:hypothetical protein
LVFLPQRVEPRLSGFGGDVVEEGAYFTPRQQRIARMNETSKAKAQLLATLWEMPR